MNPLINAHQQRIDSLFTRVSASATPFDQSEWSKYLCVLISGFIEQSFRVLLEDYSVHHSSPRIQKFVSKEVERITNCKTEKIKSTLRKFDSRWEEDFVVKISSEGMSSDEIKASIDSIVATRHAIAHGRSVGVTYASVLGYYKNAKKAVVILDSIIR